MKENVPRSSAELQADKRLGNVQIGWNVESVAGMNRAQRRQKNSNQDTVKERAVKQPMAPLGGTPRSEPGSCRLDIVVDGLMVQI